MKRSHFVTGPLAVIALTLTACGSSGSKTLSEDDFVTQMNAICKTADRAITKLDSTDKSYFADADDIIQTGLDDLGKLKAPKALKSDFDDYVSNLGDFQTQTQKLAKAVKNKDNAAAQAASDKLDKINSDNNDLADSLGADKCVDVGGGATTDTSVPETTDSVAPETTDTVAPETTDTEAPDTTDTVAPETTDTESPPNTPLSIDTTPDTVTVSTASATTISSGGGVTASDASTEFQPIAGYTWGTLEDVAGSITPDNDPVIGPLLDAYWVGVMENSTDGTPVYVYVTVLNQDTDWTAAQLAAYYNFELVGDGGVDQTTPGLGLPARVKVGSVDGYDGAVFTIPGFGVSLLAPTGADMLGLLDAFGNAQTSMG